MKSLVIKTFLLLITIITLNSCGILMNREITCREYSFKNEYFWFPHKKGDTLSFVNQFGEKKHFQVVDKRIYHQDKYISDTGCGCNDFTQMLITNYIDSIWFTHRVKYIYDHEPNHYEDIGLNFENSKNFFNETCLDTTINLKINEKIIPEVEVYSNEYKNRPENIKLLYRAKNIGIIQYITNDGEVWTLSNLNSHKSIDINNFRYETTYCGYDWMMGGFYSKKSPKKIIRPAQ
jgi:hypothetical protein